jgi:hypothetical protein
LRSRNADVTPASRECHGPSVMKPSTREEKRREEKTTTIASSKTAGGARGGAKKLNSKAEATLSRLDVNRTAWTSLPVDLTANSIIRQWLSITETARDRVAVLVRRLQNGTTCNGHIPTPAAIHAAIESGVIAAINGVPVVGQKSGHNVQGVFSDGECVLPADGVEAAVFA